MAVDIERCQRSEATKVAETASEKLLREILTHYPSVTAETAVAAYRHVMALHAAHIGSPSTEVTDGWKHGIDGAASDAMIRKLGLIPFHTMKVGSEGAKEIGHAGLEAPHVKGAFNAHNGYPELSGVSDVVEQTTRLSRLQEGSASVLAITEPGGLMPTPTDAHYMMKLIGPRQAHGVMSLDRPHEDNLYDLCQVLGIKPHELTQITLNNASRPMNTPFVNAAQRVGVNLRIVDSGDLMPGILAASQPEDNGKGYFVVATRGGIEEGVIAALGANIQGGFMQARIWDKNDEVYAGNPLLTEKNLAPGRPEVAMVSITGITGDDNLEISPITRLPYGDFMSETFILSAKGREIRNEIHGA